ncbi:MAG TPA: Ig-like domain-containing protein [Acidimicrobiales bacterium]|nr:Ig-like domain-containing protein [Acidimicrobiales bacterium]
MNGSRAAHAAPRGWWARRGLIVGVAVVVVAAGGGTVAALELNRGPSAAQIRARMQAEQQARAQARAAAIQQEESRLVAGVTVSPAKGTTGVALDAPVAVSSANGLLSSVTVAPASGPAVTGALQAAHDKWVSSGALQPSTTYTVTATVAGGGTTAKVTSTFTTLTPAALVHTTVFPDAGLSVGVGQPIVLTFNHDITDSAARKAVEARFTVAASSPVPGGWYWFSDHELHFRPQAYWPAHETISITGNLDGVDLGSGRWGTGSVSDTFAIGDSRISYANLKTEQMRVTLNGATVATYPISGGSTTYPTMNGDHIVMDRQSVVHMVSSTVGIPVNSPAGYDEYVYDDVHISDSGEYVHAAPWSVSSQGVTNVSHGCINISPTNAKSFFNFSRVGDVVEVTGSPRPPAYGDHGVMDWSTPWTDFAPATVAALGSTSTSTTSTSTPAAAAQ